MYVCVEVNKECRKRGALRVDMCVSDGVRKRKFTLEMERIISEERVSVRALVVQGDNRRWCNGIKMFACIESAFLGMTVGMIVCR